MRPLRLPWRGRDVPYAMLDVIRGCNCVCKTCYNRDIREPKPLETIERELDFIFSRRRVEFVGILGGEPLLHPDIAEIVRRIKARGVGAVMLTNGILWTDAVAAELAAAGLRMVYFHIQTGQRRSDLADSGSQAEVGRLTEAKCASAQAAGIDTAVSTTVRADRPEALRAVMESFRHNPACSHAFLTLERSMNMIDSGKECFAATNGIGRCVRELRPLGWLPFAGIGGRIDPGHFRWLVFHAYQSRDAEGRETGFAPVPPSGLERLVFALCRLFGKRLPLRTDPSRGMILARLIFNALTGGRFRNIAFALRVLLRGERLAAKNIILEAFPDLQPDGQAEYCHPCLDAVVKDGRFVPACLSDTEFAKGELPCG